MNARSIVILLSLAGAAACSSLPHVREATDTRYVYVWPTAKCPSQPVDGREFIALAPIVDLLIGTAVSTAVAIPVAALQAAAEADKAGYAAHGENPRFFATYDAAKQAAKPPQCYVVAYAKPYDSTAASNPWCADKAFAAALPKACEEAGREILDTLYPLESVRGATSRQRLDVPSFYAEIALQDSGFTVNNALIARPALAALYYPSSLLRPGSGDKRTLTVKLTMSSFGVATTDPFKTAAVSMIIPGVTPGADLTPATQAGIQTGWTLVPVLEIGKAVPLPSGTTRYGAVQISADLTEVGDPSIFLAAFAKAVQAGAPDYVKTITSELTSSGQAASSSGYQTALGKAVAAEAAYLKDCVAANPLTPAQKKAAEGDYHLMIAARIAANAAAVVANTAMPFSKDGTGPAGGAATAVCFA